MCLFNGGKYFRNILHTIQYVHTKRYQGNISAERPCTCTTYYFKRATLIFVLEGFYYYKIDKIRVSGNLLIISVFINILTIII